MKLPLRVKSFVFRRPPPARLSLKLRLWIMQGGLIALFLLGLLYILYASDIISVLQVGPYSDISARLEGKYGMLYQRCSTMYENTAELADKVNTTVQLSLEKRGETVLDLGARPGQTGELLENEIELATDAMEKAGCSGVFLILNATVSPSLPGAKNSRACIYIKNLNPQVQEALSNKYYLFRGPAADARAFGMYLDSKWQLEYTLDPAENGPAAALFTAPFQAARAGKNTDVRSLGYWEIVRYPDQETEKVLTYSLPLVDAKGTAYGVCGLEMSDLFLQSLLAGTDADSPADISFVLSKDDGAAVDLRSTVFVGGYPFDALTHGGSILTAEQQSPHSRYRSFHIGKDGGSLVGLRRPLPLYAADSPYKGAGWYLTAFLTPGGVNTSKILYLIINVVVLLILCVFCSYFISRHYSEAIRKAFRQIIDNGPASKQTDIPELDELIAYLRTAQNPPRSPAPPNGPGDALVREFLERVRVLSKTEREIFDLYLQGYTAKQVCAMRYISINTIKTHNRNIFKKLEVQSRADLLKNFGGLAGERETDTCGKK